MREKEIFAKISKSVKFLPSALHKLIYSNIIGALDINTFKKFEIEELERTININNQLTTCKIIYRYSDNGKISFTIRFKRGSLKSLLWSL